MLVRICSQSIEDLVTTSNALFARGSKSSFCHLGLGDVARSQPTSADPDMFMLGAGIVFGFLIICLVGNRIGGNALEATISRTLTANAFARLQGTIAGLQEDLVRSHTHLQEISKQFEALRTRGQ